MRRAVNTEYGELIYTLGVRKVDLVTSVHGWEAHACLEKGTGGNWNSLPVPFLLSYDVSTITPYYNKISYLWITFN